MGNRVATLIETLLIGMVVFAFGVLAAGLAVVALAAVVRSVVEYLT